MRKKFLRIGSLLTLFAVVFGAFGAHFLKTVLTPEKLEIVDTAVQYHFIHAIAVLIIAIIIHYRKTSYVIYAGWCFTIGVILFSGSLYLLAIRDWVGFTAPWLGPITPIGGTFFIIGWALLFLSSFQEKKIIRKKSKQERHEKIPI